MHHPTSCLSMSRYPGRKEENWWLLVGRPSDNSCLVVKRVPLKQKGTSKLQFNAPEQTGKQELSLYFMCDSWNGCDQVQLPTKSSCFAQICYCRKSIHSFGMCSSALLHVCGTS